MVSKKFISGLFGLFFSLNFGLYGVATNLPTVSDINICSDTKLNSCLNSIHRYYSPVLASIKYEELTRMKRVATDILLKSLDIPKDSLNNSQDCGLISKIQEIIKSGDSEQKDAAIVSVNYLMFYYKLDIETLSEIDKVYFDRASELFLREQKLFLKLCMDLINEPDTDINVCRACYEFFIQYFFKNEGVFESVDLEKVCEIGLKNKDIFICVCAKVFEEFVSQKESFDFGMLKSNFDAANVLINIRSKIRQMILGNSPCCCNRLNKKDMQSLKELRKRRQCSSSLDIASDKPGCKRLCAY